MLLQIEHLKVQSFTGAELVRDVSFTVADGEIVGLVGESGCGKSITALTVAGLLPEGIRPTRGRVVFDHVDMVTLSRQERRALNGSRIGMVFQDALTALNPLLPVGHQIGEVLKIHTDMNRIERRKRVLEVMSAVDLPNPEELSRRYPHELSGGQRQRVLIAMAVINNPSLLIADEPTTALDSVVQGQILALLKDINSKEQVSILFISHDLSTVRRLCDRVVVLYAGIPAEIGTTAQVLARPAHVYTELLLAAIPTPDKRGQTLAQIPGQVADDRGPVTFCPFAPRCPKAISRCRKELPELREVEPGHWVACFLAEGGYDLGT
ncbi:MAG: ABC transporter ATP-binding protein [Clostridiaceae bacterium]|nr:ABC transporter ATP-binding protein [Clostridiaceae bacterium]